MFGMFAKQYKAIVGGRLAAVGLKYEDLMIEGPVLEKALSRTSPAIVVDRERRIKRAFDLSAKRKTLYAQDQLKDPLDMYLEENLMTAELEEDERAALNRY